MKQKTPLSSRILTRSNQRGRSQFDWLDGRHSFSFGGYFDPERMGFGPLRVLNDDRIAPGGGFPPHPHRDMEIVTIVLDGELEHKDSLGNGSVIRAGDIQYMSAGTGVVHSEFNPSKDQPVHLLQIWIEPSEKGLPPRYEDRKLMAGRPGAWRLLLSGDAKEDSIAIRRDVELRSALVPPGESLAFDPDPARPGQWLFVLKGEVALAGETLSPGDSLGWQADAPFDLKSIGRDPAEVLLFSVPLED